ncbi:MAG: type II toxin-antitoxin system HicB family antitoxin [Polyangiaceae bacterium]|nr:type II toxin-antitoxin system HicB family antitoxin [Polyangiaceae bacterium]
MIAQDHGKTKPRPQAFFVTPPGTGRTEKGSTKPAYIALIRKEPGSCYGVEFPDFPGCISAGTTPDEAVHSAAQALTLHIRGMA